MTRPVLGHQLIEMSKRPMMDSNIQDVKDPTRGQQSTTKLKNYLSPPLDSRLEVLEVLLFWSIDPESSPYTIIPKSISIGF